MKDVCRGCGKSKNLARHLAWHAICRASYAQSDDLLCSTKALEQDEVDDDNREVEEAMASELLFNEERKVLMLTAVTRWTTDGRIGEHWKQVIKDDIRAGIQLAMSSIERELVAACGETDGAGLASMVRKRLDLFHDIYTPRQEKTSFHKCMPHFSVYERKVGPVSADLAYCTVIADWLELKIKYDSM